MKKLQFDTDSHPSVFDTVVAYDGGADHVIGHAGLTPAQVGALVDGTIFTRPPKEKKNTAIRPSLIHNREGLAISNSPARTAIGNFRKA